MNLFKKFILTLTIGLSISESFGQLAEQEPAVTVDKTRANLSNEGAERVVYDSLSVHPIDPANVLYRVTNWRRMDMKEKMNQPFFSSNNEITKFLLEGVKKGILTAYTNDSVNTVLSAEALSKNLEREDTGGDGLSEEEKAAGFGTETATDDGWGSPTKPSDKKGATSQSAGTDDGWGTPTTSTVKKDKNGKPIPNTTPVVKVEKPAGTGGFGNTAAPVNEYYAKELSILEIKEDYIFDKQRSRAYNSIQTITIVIPAEKTIRGFNVPVATFRYKDLDKYFRSNPKCIWYNTQNIAQHRNMADAFDLRLFNARIIKQSNPGDRFLVDSYKGEKAGLKASQQLEYKLMEFEHNLWEY